jgi:ribose/xylose/arabinose/galactoside ABC-type transport system permease subunit
VPTSLVFFGLNSDWQIVFQGVILIIAVSIDGHRQRSVRA